jgi:hypothetical protein
MRSSLAFLLAALSLAAAAAAQPPAPPAAQAPPTQRPDGAEHWTSSAERMIFTATETSFPRRAGAVRLNRSIAFGRRNAGLDNGLIYASDDRALIATAYIYLPGLAHDGLAALVSEHFMRIQSGAGFRLLGRRVTAGGGRDGVAIRADYAGFRDENEASSSAFFRAGRWIVKLRVSGPESRRAEVERTMAAFLADIRFEGEVVPGAAAPVEVAGCPPAAAAPAAALLAPNAIEATEDAIMAVAEAMPGNERRRGSWTPSVGRLWCVSSSRQAGPYALPILRSPPSAPAEDSRRSVALAVLNDSGGMLEVVERRFRNRSRYMLLQHNTGQTRVLGSYDGPPTDAQIGAVLDGADTAGARARATIDYRPNGDSSISLHVAPE